MSGYIGEPEKMIPDWEPENAAMFEYGPKMRKLADSILQHTIDNDDIDGAIRKLCETASRSDSIECRTVLAQIAEVPFTELGLYKDAIGRNRGLQDYSQVMRIISLALEAYDIGDTNKFYLLTASVGCYPCPPQILAEVYSN
jgi:hypothetical protein